MLHITYMWLHRLRQLSIPSRDAALHSAKHSDQPTLRVTDSLTTPATPDPPRHEQSPEATNEIVKPQGSRIGY